MGIRMKEEIVRHFNDVQVIKDVCGELRVLSTIVDFELASLAVATIYNPSIPHYHTSITEFYFVWDGTGRIIVGREHYEIATGTMIIIPPNRVHYTIPRKVMKVLAFSVPAWFKEDQIIIENEDEVAAHYSAHKEKLQLIEELLIRSDLGFTEKMDLDERETLDSKRQQLILKVGWNKMSIPELRRALAP